MKLIWHNYRYYPYERELARRESAALLPEVCMQEAIDGLEIVGSFNSDIIKRLAYFSGMQNGHSFTPTTQYRLESTVKGGKRRQATRYSTHGLHEYKGKFNPQVVKSLLNIFEIEPGSNVFDPFCGSGTTLVECAHLGISSFGTDINPLAVYITNTKIQALATPSSYFHLALKRIMESFKRTKHWTTHIKDNQRSRYLQDWFDLPILHTLEIVRAKIESETGSLAPFFLVIASNLLRRYSRQDPHDLRIRRRKSPLPNTPFLDEFIHSTKQAIARLEDAQCELESSKLEFGEAMVDDVTALTSEKLLSSFDAAITSPPYAMALPYIDTQRLSLVWLELLNAKHIRELDANLIGSREFMGDARRKSIKDRETNAAELPTQESEFCNTLQCALKSKDGFRRRAVPNLLYRYFTSMRDSFSAIRKVMKPNAPFGLIVGHNHTVLGNVRYDIDTPTHITSLAENAGWNVEEIMPLQTYQRYGYNMNNAISSESLIILRN